MSQEHWICSECHKVLSNKYNLQAHVRRMHQREETKEIMKCSSDPCAYTTTNRNDLKKHEQRCMNVHFDQVLDSRVQQIHHEFNTQLTRMQNENNRLQAENDLLREQLQKAQEKSHELSQQAINRPTTSNNIHQSVKITNYLASHDTYQKQTDPERLRDLLHHHLPEYYPDGQSGVARFLDDHVIRTDQNEMILCCTDPTRNRFRYLNENNEMVDDMRAHHFTKKVSEPVKQTALQLFQERMAEIERRRNDAKDPFEQLQILQELDVYRDTLLKIASFDDHSSNHQFVGALADRLRHPVPTHPADSNE